MATRDRETVDEYLARKEAKGVLGVEKPYLWEGRKVRTGYCPCLKCGHEGEAMILCDPDYDDCQCCQDVCS